MALKWRRAGSSRWECVAAIVLLGCMSAVATAQITAGATPAASSSDQLAEIVVTAEKRESTVQATPISITAISGAELSARGITDVEEVAQETPGMSFRTSGPGQTEYEMRGVSSTGGSTGTVGFYLNETPITPPSFGGIGKVVIDPELFDMQSVEVLRGPQGTLYGAGSMGGTIRLITHPPVMNQFDAAVEVSGSGTDGGGINRGGSLMLNVPISDSLMAFRLVASSEYRDGWLDRIVVNPFPLPSNAGCPPTLFTGCVRGNVAAGPLTEVYPRVNSERLNTVRPTLLITPTDRLSITISALYQDTKLGGYDNIDIPPGCSSSVLCGHYQPEDVPEPFADTVKLLSAVVHYDASVADITSASSYWSRNETQTQDASEAIENLIGPPFVRIPYTETDHSAQFSEELRAVSTGDGPFQWVGGLFYSNFQYSLYQYSANSYFADPIANPQGVLVDLDVPYDTKQYAAFAEASYKISPAWKITAGLREFRYRSTLSFIESGLFSPNSVAAPFTENVETSEHSLNPKFNLAYIPDDNLTVYGTASKGFRPGGISEPIPTSGPANCGPSLKQIGYTGSTTTYGPDSLWNFELGEKARLLEGRVSVHSDVYYIRWAGIQQVIPLTCGFLLEANAGNARSYGPEVEIEAKVATGVTLTVNGAYTNATINQPSSFSGVLAGQPLLNIPKYTTSASLEYQRPIFDGMTLRGRASETVVGPQYDIAYAQEQLSSYALTDLRLGLSRDQWTATLFVNNATNKQAILTINNTFFTENIPDLTRATVNQPRTIGVKLDYHLH